MVLRGQLSAEAEWQLDLLDLPAYLDRIGVALPSPAADEETLALLHRAHVLSIPFENADMLLGGPMSLDLGAIQDKLVRSGRGGYCYEHTLLFAAALERIGFPVRRLSGRIRMGSDEVRARTHVALLVGDPRDGWLADVGLGSAGPIGPMRWRDGQRSDEGRWSFRLDRTGGHGPDDPDEWIVSTARPEGWFSLYSLDRVVQHPIDYETGHYYVSTHPDSPFVDRLVAGSTRPGSRWRLSDRTCTVETAPGQLRQHELDDGELGRVLVEEMGIGLGADELATLAARTRTHAVTGGSG